MAANYTYVTTDLVTGQIVEEVPLSSVRWGRGLNTAGGFSGSINARHPKAAAEVLYPCKRGLYVIRNGLVVWAGIIWGARLDNGNVEVAARGLWSYFSQRLILTTTTFTGVDQLVIARTLIDNAQDAPGGSIGITTGSETCGVLRDRTYIGYECKPVAEAIEQLSATQGGFDFEILTERSGSTFTNTFKLHYPKQGRRTPIVWDVGTHCDASSWQVDGDRIGNFMRGLGAGDGDQMLISDASNPNVLSEYPRYDDTVSYRDVSVPATLAGYAELWRTRRQYPLVMPSITLRPTVDSGVGSFVCGDEVRLQGTDGWATLDGAFTIASFEVAVSDEGDESVEVTFQNPEAMS